MSIPTGEGLPPDVTVEELYGTVMGATERLDETAQVYFSTCGSYSKWPDAKNLEGIADASEAHMLASEHFLAVLAEDVGEDEFRKEASQFLRTQDWLRVNTLNTLLGSDSLQTLGSEVDLELPNEAVEGQTINQTLATVILLRHQTLFVKDTHSFLAEIGGSDAARRMERHIKFKEQAVNLGKVSIAAALGAVVGGSIVGRIITRGRN